MNVYEVTYRHGYGDGNTKTYNVLAKDATEAISFAIRYAKKNYHSDARVTTLELVKKIDIHYKTSK